MSLIVAFFVTAAVGIDFCGVLQRQDIKPPPYICFSCGNVDVVMLRKTRCNKYIILRK